MRRLATVLLLALIAVKTAAVLARGPVTIEMDAAGYWLLSTSVMGGEWLMLDQPIAFRTPMYPWFLASVRSLSGADALMWIAAIQGLLSLASVWIAARLAARITQLPRATPIALLASLPMIASLVYNATMLSETLFIFVLMVNLSAVQNYVERQSKWAALWAGVTFGITLLTRPIVLLLWTVHVAFVGLMHLRRRRLNRLASRPFPWSRRLLHGMIAAIMAFTIISPWLVRNQLLFGKPFLTEFVGRNLWIVTFQDGSGSAFPIPETDAAVLLTGRLDRVGVVDDRDLTWTVAGGLVASGLNDPQTDRLMKQVAVDAIEQDPKRFAVKAVQRIVNFWRTRSTEIPTPGIDGQFYGQRTWQYDVPMIGDVVDAMIRHRAGNLLWVNTTILFFLAAATCIVIFHRPTRMHGVWIVLIFGYFAVVTGVFEIPAYRYRMVVEPLAVCTVGAAIAILWSKRTMPAKPSSNSST
ncbi:hypothetical protein Poly51_41230 [Rubripirellula tenax]|uniref:Glycosyltransferase RgtA/B/C/D-like domain-containing protein n=1 Tax=Rubripirellula tenax TaxID=2528015 RepID=A0A5C6ER92_9BACT|nr:glycosyltransferase family 39 protein [Rubripirellula tenax]TWU50830.1 hypothetical protein Poly51_41230 [Rubripirellula tenax]